MLRREFEIEGAGVFSDSQWLMSLKKTEEATAKISVLPGFERESRVYPCHPKSLKVSAG